MTDTHSSTDVIVKHAGVYVPVVEASAPGRPDAISVGVLFHPNNGQHVVSISVTSKDGTGHAALLGPDDMVKFDAALSEAVMRLVRARRANDKPAPTATH